MYSMFIIIFFNTLFVHLLYLILHNKLQIIQYNIVYNYFKLWNYFIVKLIIINWIKCILFNYHYLGLNKYGNILFTIVGVVLQLMIYRISFLIKLIKNKKNVIVMLSFSPISFPINFPDNSIIMPFLCLLLLNIFGVILVFFSTYYNGFLPMWLVLSSVYSLWDIMGKWLYPVEITKNEKFLYIFIIVFLWTLCLWLLFDGNFSLMKFRCESRYLYMLYLFDFVCLNVHAEIFEFISNNYNHIYSTITLAIFYYHSFLLLIFIHIILLILICFMFFIDCYNEYKESL